MTVPSGIPTLLTLAAVFASTAWSPLAAQSPALDACSVLTRDEIKALSGKDPGPPDPGGSGDNTTCRWLDGDPSGGRVALYATVDPKEPKGLALKQLRDRGMNARAVEDLGDDAVFLEDADDSPSGTVFVRVGHWRVVITRDADPKATAASTLPTLTALAQAAVQRLRKAE
jgi:hypothetical protein